MVEILKSIGKGLISALLTEKFVKEIIIYLLEKLAKKSDNKVLSETSFTIFVPLILTFTFTIIIPLKNNSGLQHN